MIDGSTGRGKRRGEPFGRIDLPTSGTKSWTTETYFEDSNKVFTGSTTFVTALDAVVQFAFKTQVVVFGFIIYLEARM